MPSHLQPIVYQIQSQCRTIISFFQEESSRYVLARLLATLLCASAATALWVYDENLADPFAFLTLTYRELAFPPGPSIGTYVETSTINIIAICISVIHCNIGKILAAFVARHYGHSSSRSRVVPACFLVSLAFGAGAVKSAYPRLAQACRMAGITAVFLLTSGVGEDRTLTSDWTSFLLISAIASLSSLISTACFLRRSSKAFTRLLILSFSHLRRHLGSKPTIHTSAELLEALNLPSNTQLRRAYLQAFFEPRYSRLHVKDLRPFMKVVERLRAELSWGSVVPLHSRFSSFAGSYANFEGPTTAMTSALCDSLALLERTICLVFDMSLSPSTSEVSPPLSVFQYTEHLKQIHDAYRHLRHQLEVTHASADHRQAEGFPWSTEDATQDIFAISLYTISRLQVANDVSAALRLARTIYEKAGRNSRRRLWLPKPTHAWFSSSVSNSAWDSVDADFDEFARDASHYSLPPEHREEIIEAEESYHNKIVPPPSMQEKSSTRFRFYRHIWNRMKFAWSSMLTARLRWSRRLHSLKHSEHLHYAFKNAIGVSLLSLPAFLAPTSSGYKWFLEFHGQWIIVTYIFVLETNTGATIRTGGLRLIGTICGAVYAYLAWLISRHNSIALVALITLSDLPISWLILQTPVASIGVVAYVTIPPIIYPNLDRVQIKPTILLAVNRGSAIGLGIIAAVLMNHFVFPRHCRLIFLTQTSKTLRQLTELYISLTKHTIHAVSSASPDSRRNTKLENEIRDSLYRANTLIDMMHLEICILPKPSTHTVPPPEYYNDGWTF